MSPTKPKASRHARGYGSARESRRRSLESYVRSGRAFCTRCGQLIQPGETWHLDHRDDRAGYLGAAHAVCNLRAAAAKTNEKRARSRESTLLRWSRQWFALEPGSVVDYGDGRIAAD